MECWTPRNPGTGWHQAGPCQVKARSGQLVMLSANRCECIGAVSCYLLIGSLRDTFWMSACCILKIAVQSIKLSQTCHPMFIATYQWFLRKRLEPHSHEMQYTSCMNPSVWASAHQVNTCITSVTSVRDHEHGAVGHCGDIRVYPIHRYSCGSVLPTRP